MEQGGLCWAYSPCSCRFSNSWDWAYLGESRGTYLVVFTLRSPLHRLFPYGITVGALTIVFLLIMDVAIMQRSLLPGWVLLGAFVLLVLYMAGLIETGIQLFGNDVSWQHNLPQIEGKY